jgi:hypothetical protein
VCSSLVFLLVAVCFTLGQIITQRWGVCESSISGFVPHLTLLHPTSLAPVQS